MQIYTFLGLHELNSNYVTNTVFSLTLPAERRGGWRACWESKLVRATGAFSHCLYHSWHSWRRAHSLLSDQLRVQDK